MAEGSEHGEATVRVAMGRNMSCEGKKCKPCRVEIQTVSRRGRLKIGVPVRVCLLQR